MGRIVCDALNIYWYILLAAVLSSWLFVVGRPPQGGMRTVVDGLRAITDPVFRPVRSLLPPVRAGGMAIDLSPIVVFIVLGIILRAVC